MAGELQPLDQQFAIVDAQGRPTLYFTQWAQQRQIDITDAITSDQAIAIITQYLEDHRLSNVQEILDQISTTRGSVLYRGAAGWAALAPGASGQFLKTNGAGTDPAWAAAGGSGIWWLAYKPAAADFPSRINTTNPITVSDDADIGLMINGGTPVNDSLLRIAYRAGPPSSGDWWAKARISPTLNVTATCGAGLCLIDTVSNRVNFFGRFSNTPTNVQRWTLPTGLNSNTFTNTLMGGVNNPGWFGFQKTGTALNFLVSADGKNWTTIYTETATSWLTNPPNAIGFGINYETGSGDHLYLSCDYWQQSW